MQTTEVVHARIDALNEGLSSAVRKTDGAQFALMLSMISESQAQVSQLESKADEDVVSSAISSRDELYTAEIVGRLNQAFHRGEAGELALLISWLESVPLEGRRRPPVESSAAQLGADQMPLSQAAVLARRYGMLDEIRESRLSFAA